jgi:hypothetical protein
MQKHPHAGLSHHDITYYLHVRTRATSLLLGNITTAYAYPFEGKAWPVSQQQNQLTTTTKHCTHLLARQEFRHVQFQQIPLHLPGTPDQLL